MLMFYVSSPGSGFGAGDERVPWGCGYRCNTRRLRVSKAMPSPFAAKFTARVRILELRECSSGVYFCCPSSSMHCLDPRRDHDMYFAWSLSHQTLSKLKSLEVEQIRSSESVAAVPAHDDAESKRYTPATFMRNQTLGVCEFDIVSAHSNGWQPLTMSRPTARVNSG